VIKPLSKLIKFSYFADTTERGHKGVKAEGIGGERDGDFTDNFNVEKGFKLRDECFEK
jgi:hypothetical protein